MCIPSALTSDAELDAPYRPCSVHEDCVREAEIHKWIESEKAGRDLGEYAILSWIHKHWNGYLRDRWLEHLEGVRFWIELDHGDFGILRREFRDSPHLPEIVQLLKARAENLTILLWAHENNKAIPDVLRILTALDMNSRRIECKLQARLRDCQMAG